MRDVLVCFASRHGATEELAQAIGAELARAGISVDVRSMNEVDDVDDLKGYSAFVVGSAVYMGRWLPSARAFLERHQNAIAVRPTWLFSSGPIGDPPVNGNGGFDPTELMEETHARDHHLFGGKLDRNILDVRERLITRLVRARDGDHRDWAILAAWAAAISHSLTDEYQGSSR